MSASKRMFSILSQILTSKSDGVMYRLLVIQCTTQIVANHSQKSVHFMGVLHRLVRLLIQYIAILYSVPHKLWQLVPKKTCTCHGGIQTYTMNSKHKQRFAIHFFFQNEITFVHPLYFTKVLYNRDMNCLSLSFEQQKLLKLSQCMQKSGCFCLVLVPLENTQYFIHH